MVVSARYEVNSGKSFDDMGIEMGPSLKQRDQLGAYLQESKKEMMRPWVHSEAVEMERGYGFAREARNRTMSPRTQRLGIPWV